MQAVRMFGASAAAPSLAAIAATQHHGATRGHSYVTLTKNSAALMVISEAELRAAPGPR